MRGQHQLEIVNQILKQHFTDIEYKFAMQERDATSAWLQLSDPKEIIKVAQTIAELEGRVMAITASEAQAEGMDIVEVVYHFAVGVLNCNCIVTLADNARQIESITSIMKSANWQEREMQELYNIRVQHHPNPKALFLEEGFSLSNHSMVPLSEAMNGAMTTTLWERIMQGKNPEVEKDE